MSRKKLKKFINYNVYYEVSNNKRLKLSDIRLVDKGDACYSQVVNRNFDSCKYVHHILTPAYHTREYLVNIKAVAKELRCIGAKFYTLVRKDFSKVHIIRLPFFKEYNHNIFYANFIRNLFYETKSNIIDYDLYFKGLRGLTDDVCPNNDGVYRLLYYQNKAVANSKVTYGRGDHNILYKNCNLYTSEQIDKVYKTFGDINTSALLTTSKYLKELNKKA
jgi:hypothetical protein